MKIRRVLANNRRKAFEVTASTGRTFLFPYAKLDVRPSPGDRVVSVFVDAELGREAFTYRLESDRENSVHIDQVLEYNEDPAYLRELLVYKLTLEAQRRVEASSVSKREIIRKLHTSAAQFYRLLDPRNTRKSIDQLISLLHTLDCDVKLVIRRRPAAA